jgi:hypothetical protein
MGARNYYVETREAEHRPQPAQLRHHKSTWLSGPRHHHNSTSLSGPRHHKSTWLKCKEMCPHRTQRELLIQGRCNRHLMRDPPEHRIRCPSLNMLSSQIRSYRVAWEQKTYRYGKAIKVLECQQDLVSLSKRITSLIWLALVATVGRTSLRSQMHRLLDCKWHISLQCTTCSKVTQMDSRQGLTTSARVASSQELRQVPH